jgi:YggT family protein
MFGIGGGCVEDATVGAETICLLFNFLAIAIFIRVLVSWIPLITSKPIDEGNPLIQALRAVTDPLIEPVRSVMPRGMMIDFSPMIVLIVLQIASPYLQRLMVDNGI